MPKLSMGFDGHSLPGEVKGVKYCVDNEGEGYPQSYETRSRGRDSLPAGFDWACFVHRRQPNVVRNGFLDERAYILRFT